MDCQSNSKCTTRCQTGFKAGKTIQMYASGFVEFFKFLLPYLEQEILISVGFFYFSWPVKCSGLHLFFFDPVCKMICESSESGACAF